MQKIGYNELRRCDVFLMDNGKIAYQIPRCSVCHTENAMVDVNSDMTSDICVDCTRKIHAALTAKYRLSKSYTNTTLAKQQERLSQLVILPGDVPEWVSEDLEHINRYFKTLEGETKRVRCSYCGELETFSVQKLAESKKHKCNECTARYAKFRNFCSRINKLSMKECVDFSRLLDEYVELMRRGYWAPDVPKYRAKIRRLYDKYKEM